MMISDEMRFINEIIAHGSSPRAREILAQQGMIVEIDLGDGQPRRFPLRGDCGEMREVVLPKLRILVNSSVLSDLSLGKLNAQEAQILGLIKLEGASGLVRLFQRATQWGLVNCRSCR